MKIEDLHINQRVQLITSQPDWQDVNDVTIVGLNIDRDGHENITIQCDGNCRYDGWKADNFLPIGE